MKGGKHGEVVKRKVANSFLQLDRGVQARLTDGFVGLIFFC